jgi:hypothetical protein
LVLTVGGRGNLVAALLEFLAGIRDAFERADSRRNR